MKKYYWGIGAALLCILGEQDVPGQSGKLRHPDSLLSGMKYWWIHSAENSFSTGSTT